MRVILDANIWLSFLIDADPSSIRTLPKVVFAVLGNPLIELILPIETIGEIDRIVTTKRYYQRMQLEDVWNSLRPHLTAMAQSRHIDTPSSRQSRDVNDDYLLAAMDVYHCDFLVTGDKDLLSMDDDGNGIIVNVNTFWNVLQEMDLTSE